MPTGPNDLIPAPEAPPAFGGPLATLPDHERLVQAFLSGRSPRTLRAYRADLADFARWAGAPEVAEAARLLLQAGQGGANWAALAYRAALTDRGLAPSTISRRLAALHSLVRLARTLGLVGWTLEVEAPRTETLRDTRGPGREGFRRVLAQLQDRNDAKGARDRALLRLLFDLALRRAEAVGLDVAHLDLTAGVVWVLGKGRTQRERLSLPGPTHTALVAWLAFRGDAPGPLFTSLDRAGKGNGRLSGSAVYAIIRSLGERAGLRARPHGLRHAAITEALDRTNGDVRKVQRFSRHRDVRVLTRYDDNRQDLAGDVARLVADK
jgi:integrase/recombinase XerC